MIVCPVCEHVQGSGRECEVCGRPLATDASTEARPEPLPGLEPTSHPAAPELSESMPDLEATAIAAPEGWAVRDAPALGGLEPTEAADLPGDGPTPVPVAILCRYCRSPAMPGERICATCGMRLPVFEAARDASAPGSPVRCACGTQIPGDLCPSCGARRAER